MNFTDMKHRECYIFETDDRFIAFEVKATIPCEASTGGQVYTLSHFVTSGFCENKYNYNTDADFMLAGVVINNAKKVSRGKYYEFIIEKMSKFHTQLDEMLTTGEPLFYSPPYNAKLGIEFMQFLYLVENKNDPKVPSFIFR